MGTLMRKIHSQPAASMSMPPRIGPTSPATPAVDPHSAMAPPRRWGGKIRAITVIVCGDIIDAPRPWTTRAAMSQPIPRPRVPVKPHHADDRVKMTRPIM